MAQSLQLDDTSGGPIILNGQFDRLGTFKDLVHGGRLNTPVKITFGIADFTYEFELKYRLQRREIELTKFKLLENGDSLYEYQSTKDRYDVKIKGKKIEEVAPFLRKMRPRLRGFIPNFPYVAMLQFSQRDNPTEFPYNDEVFTFLRGIERKVNSFRRMAVESFSNYDTLGAFREMPERTYLSSGETAAKVGRFGENTVAILANDASKRGGEQIGLVEQISKWLSDANIAKGIKVKYLTERHYELVVIGKDGLDHNICDVGFGCSQVLPVLVSGIELKYRARPFNARATLVVQEPEIHLHPNAQADLGTFYAGIIGKNSQVFLETHSDNLVLRVAYHIAAGDISSDDVRIFYVNDIEGRKEVTPISVSSDGAFVPTWPGGFFPQRQAESLALARAAMQRSSTEISAINEDKLKGERK